MKVFISLTLLAFSFISFAEGIQAEWKCPENSSSRSVNVFFDDQGKLNFNPNVIEQNVKGASRFDVGVCLSNFQKSIKESIQALKTSQCPASKDQFCYASSGYAETKVWERLNGSSLAKKNSIILSAPTSSLPTNNPGVVTPTQTPESFLESKIVSKEIDPKNISHQFSFAGKRYKVGEFDKVIADNLKNVFSELSPAESRQYAQNYMLLNSQVLNTEAQSPKRTTVLNNLNKMFGYIYGEKGPEELAKMLECKPEDDLTPIQDILENLDDSKKMSKCEPLQNGSHKVFSKEEFYSTGNYLLRKDANGTYKITLNVDFKSGAGSVPPAEMLQRSKACLALASQAMKGPNGERMTIEVLSPAETLNLPSVMRPKPNTVTIEGPQFGTNAASYAENVNCPIISHEMFHLLGMCDEYKEERPEYAHLNWTCRVITKAPSIMRDTGVFNQALGQATNCDCNTEACRTIMNGDNQPLKDMYLNQTFYDMSDYKFRNAYCKESFLPEGKMLTLTNAGKNVLLNQSEDQSFEVESRFVTNVTTAPFYRILRSKIVCTCPAGDADCEKNKVNILSKVNRPDTKTSCPMGAPWKAGDRGTLAKGAHYKDGVITLIGNPTIPSLLQPNHFHKILEGNCPNGKSQGYQECAEFAYKKPPCDVPAKCQEDSYYLGSQQ